MKDVNKKILRAFSAVFLLFGLQQFSMNAAAEIVKVTIAVDENGAVTESTGNVTPSMISVTNSLLQAIGNINDSKSCVTTNDGIICNVANTPNVELNMNCESGNDFLKCSMGRIQNYDSPYTIDCEKEASKASCTITHNDEGIKALVDDAGITNVNAYNVANSFLTCMQGAVGNAERSCSQLIAALGSGDDADVVRILNSLAPLNPEAPSNLVRDNINNGTSVIFQRLGQIRTNTDIASHVSTQLFFANNQWLEAGTRLAANDSLASDVTPGTVSTSISDFGKLGFFINLNATDGKYKNGSLSSSSNFTSTLLTIGFDYRVRDDLVTGLAFNIGQSKTKYKSTVNGKMDSDSYSLIVYNSFYKDSWYFDSSLTIGGDSYRQNRDPIAFNNSFDAQYHSMQYNLSLAGGYDFYVQGFGLTPFVQVDLGQLHIDGYKEKAKNTSGGGVALAMNKHKRDIGSLNVGGRFRYIFTTSKGVFIPNLTLTAVNDFKNDAQVVTGRFIGLNSNSSGFAIKAEKSDSDYFVIATGFSMQLKNGNAGFFNLESLQGYDNLDQMRVTLGWRWEL